MTNLYNHPSLNKRQLRAQIDPITGEIVFAGILTEACYADTVDCVIPNIHALPIIFVAGVMGSNLCDKDPKLARTKGDIEKIKDVWLVDSDVTMASWIRRGPAERQAILHPSKTFVYERGDVPGHVTGILTGPEHYWARGWGEVGAMSYKEFLLWLENQLNAGGIANNHDKLNTVLEKLKDREVWHAQKPFEPLTPAESEKSLQWIYPVHACGYNWLDNCAASAKRLADRIDEVMALYNKRGTCKQVILVTHSMGGLVARYCSEVDDAKRKHKAMRKKIAGIVHGVMPTVGAVMAYRRCKVGMWDEDKGASLVIGRTGQEITAVFAQAPGTLQLLPSKQYPVQNWLEIVDSNGAQLPGRPMTDDPYKNVYLERKKWWGLVKEEWLAPSKETAINWTTFKRNIAFASDFHSALKDKYHANTWGFFGSMGYEVKKKTKRAELAPNSYARITWVVEPGTVPLTNDAPDPNSIAGMKPDQVRQSGSNPVDIPAPDTQTPEPEMYIPAAFARTDFGNKTESIPASYFRIRLAKPEGSGDSTVPVESGSFPCTSAGTGSVKQFFKVSGIGHEPAYKDKRTQHLTAYAIGKIAAGLPLPTPGKA